jgi:CheY-like chemotaxis protein
MDLGALIRDMLPILKRLLPENVTIHYVSCPEEALVHADRGQMEQVLMNLCINARDAMPDGGTIAVRVRSTVLDESFLIGRPWGRIGRFLLLEVSDTGCGMDRETIEHIFEPFFTTKEPGKGSGLGLSTVYGIVKQHQGLIDVESEEGRGATLRIYLPIIVAPAAQVQAPRVNGRVLRGTETVLVVEDHEDLRQLLTRGLADLGYRTLEASDGEGALAILSAPGTEVDLVVSDVVMPGMGGFELLRASRRFAPRLAFLLCSGYHDEAHQRWSLPDDRVAFLAKPFEIATLASKIQELLAAR